MRKSGVIASAKKLSLSDLAHTTLRFHRTNARRLARNWSTERGTPLFDKRFMPRQGRRDQTNVAQNFERPFIKLCASQLDLDQVTLDESIGMAFLVVLGSMTPAERVAFILHDVFRYSFAEVAEIVGRTPAACRQLASSARHRVHASQVPRLGGPGRQGLQAGLGSRGHRRPHRPA